MRRSVTRLLRASLAKPSTNPLQRLAQSVLRDKVVVSEEVADALHGGLPVVSLETAITTHGLPLEQAITSASDLEQIIRKRGAVPATIGLLDGICKIGLTAGEIERLADPDTKGRGKWKVGRRDIAPAMLKRVDGGTTVSATSFLSNLVGIEVFVTGGIGGVHRGAQETMDVSSDLTELGRTPVAVVCAGAKSILDIGLTLEYLETLGVTVATFGETDDFPAFYARKSGFKAPFSVRTAVEAAELIHFSNSLNTQTGTLIGVPIPEEYEQRSSLIQKAVEQAIEAAQANGIAKRGKEVTPWILAQVKELTGGNSVESNLGLIKNNAEVGSSIAVELARFKTSFATATARAASSHSAAHRAGGSSVDAVSDPSHQQNDVPKAVNAPISLAVIGAAAVDIVARPNTPNVHTTAVGTIALTLGGVARNVFEAAYKSGVKDAVLIAPVGKEGQDPLAGLLIAGLESLGASSVGLMPMSGHTPSVNMMLDETGDLSAGVADIAMAEAVQGQQIIQRLQALQPSLVCFDGNISSDAISVVLDHCKSTNVPTVFEPTSNDKSLKFLKAIDFSGPALGHMAPNIHELRALNAYIQRMEVFDRSPYFRATLNSYDTGEIFRNQLRTQLPAWVTDEGIVQMAIQLLPFVECIWLKAGKRGLLVVQSISNDTDKAPAEAWRQFKKSGNCVLCPGSKGSIAINYFPALPLNSTESVVGGGDSMLGGILAGLVKGMRPTNPRALKNLAHIGQSAAIASLSSANSVGDLTQVRTMLEQALTLIPSD